MPAIELRDLYAARKRIAGIIRHTDLAYSASLSAVCAAKVYLKLETQQVTGAFKVRGAANRLLQMKPEERARGVITVSTGNHGRAVAYVAQRLGMAAVVCVPELVLPHKVKAMTALGAVVRVVGASQDEAEAAALEMARAEGLMMVSPFDDPAIIAGQGTIGLEILEDLPEVDMVVAPLSGGGLLGGIALALKSASASICTIGVSMARAPAMAASLAAGRPVQLAEEASLADSLTGGIGLENRYTFDLIRQLVDDTVLLSEEEIASAMVHALREEHLVVEGGGSVAVGALLHGKLNVAGKTVAAVVSGGNVEMALLARLMQS